MVAPAAGKVVLVPFSFSDLSRSRLRPAVILPDVGMGDGLLCQVTSNPYSDPAAVELTAADFRVGSLQLTSYAHPDKPFAAHQSLMVSEVGRLTDEALNRLIDAVVNLLRPTSIP